jgi:hypothetical protein
VYLELVLNSLLNIIVRVNLQKHCRNDEIRQLNRFSGQTFAYIFYEKITRPPMLVNAEIRKRNGQ